MMRKSGQDGSPNETNWHTPIPSAALLLGSGMMGLAGFGLRRRRGFGLLHK